jgi:hypothetical protein
VKGTVACQETGSRAQASGAVCRGTRAIWRKLDCLKPSLQKAQDFTRRKDARNRRRPLPRGSELLAGILRGAGAMPCRGIEGDERDACVALDTYGSCERGITRLGASLAG